MAKGKKTGIFDNVRKALDGGMSVAEASRKFKVSRATIYTWKKDVKEAPPKEVNETAKQLLTSSYYEVLTQENEELRRELKAQQYKIDMLVSMLTVAVLGPGEELAGMNVTTKWKGVVNDTSFV